MWGKMKESEFASTIGIVNKSTKKNPFFKHLITADHTFDFDGSHILDIKPNYYCRVTSKSVNIYSQSNPINIQQDSDEFHCI